MTKLTHFDICGSKIENGRCNCGEWKSAEEMKDNPFIKALDAFHEMKKMALTGDAPHLGVAFVFFRGDYSDCLEIDQFIKKLKKRPFYDG